MNVSSDISVYTEITDRTQQAVFEAESARLQRVRVARRRDRRAEHLDAGEVGGSYAEMLRQKQVVAADAPGASPAFSCIREGLSYFLPAKVRWCFRYVAFFLSP